MNTLLRMYLNPFPSNLRSVGLIKFFVTSSGENFSFDQVHDSIIMIHKVWQIFQNSVTSKLKDVI